MNAAFKIFLFVISSLSLSMFSLQSVNADDLLSPRKQMSSGIDAEDVECKLGFTLMIRSTNGAVACVKPSTSIQLSNVGWGNIIKSAMEEPTLEEPTPEESEENVIEVKISDGVGSGDR
jgi:hypothetical protein